MRSGTWARKAQLPVAISEVGVAQVDGRVYVVGGTEQGGEASDAHLMYDPPTDRWHECAPLPQALHHVGVTELGGKLYAFGGLTGNVHLNPQRRAFAYDPRSDRWSDLPSLTRPRGSLAVAACNAKIHVFGGRNAERVERLSPPGAPETLAGIGTVTTHEIFDPAQGTWTAGEPLPGPPRDHMGIAVLDEKIHVFGGRINDFSDLLNRHDVYDPAARAWTSAAPLPRPRSAGAFTVLDGLIIYAGGECKPGGRPFTPNAFEDVTAYDPRTDRWSALTPLPEGRHAFGAATVADVAYFAGGALLCGGGASVDMLALTIGSKR